MWKKNKFEKTEFFSCFFSPSNLDFFSEKKTNLFFFYFRKKKFEFGVFLLWIWIFSEENCFWYISEVFSSEKIQIHKRKRPNSNLVFFSEIKKNQTWKFGFFFRKKNPKDMVNFVLVMGAPEVFNLPNNEFFRNLTWTLWVPIGFTTASIKDLLQFWFSWFHGVPPLDFLMGIYESAITKIQRGDPMKSGKSKLQ